MDPLSDTAQAGAEEARVLLQRVIERTGNADPYPFHILGSQGLAWVKRGIKNPQAKGQYLESLKSIVRDGMKLHPRVEDLKQLYEDIDREYLGLAVTAQLPLTPV